MGETTSLIKASQERYGSHWPTQVFATLFAVVFGTGLAMLCWVLGDNAKSIGYNYLLLILGSVSGWLAGVIFSPFNSAQTTRFRFVGQTIAAFGSGYLVSSLSPVFLSVLEEAAKAPKDIPWPQLGLLTSSFILTATVVFVSRIHVRPDPQSTSVT